MRFSVHDFASSTSGSSSTFARSPSGDSTMAINTVQLLMKAFAKKNLLVEDTCEGGGKENKAGAVLELAADPRDYASDPRDMIMPALTSSRVPMKEFPALVLK